MKFSICLVVVLAIVILPHVIVADFLEGIFDSFKGTVLKAVPLRDRYLRLWELVDVRKKLEKGTISATSTCTYIEVFNNEKQELWNIRDGLFKNITNLNTNSRELKAFEQAYDESNKYYQAHAQNLVEQSFNTDEATEYLDTLITIRETFEEWMNTINTNSLPIELRKEMVGGILSILGFADTK